MLSHLTFCFASGSLPHIRGNWLSVIDPMGLRKNDSLSSNSEVLTLTIWV